MPTDTSQQVIDVAAPGRGSYPVARGHRRGVRSPHTCDAARWPPPSLASRYVPQRSTTAVLARCLPGTARPETVATAVLEREGNQAPDCATLAATGTPSRSCRWFRP